MTQPTAPRPADTDAAHDTSPPDTHRSQTPQSGGHLLFFGEDWGRHPSTAQYLAAQLLDDFTVTWVNSIGLREPSLTVADLGRVVGKIKRALPTATSDIPSVQPPTSASDAKATSAPAPQPQHLVSPWIVPLHRFAAVQAMNAALLKRQLARLPYLQHSPYQIITANPASYYLLDALGSHKSLYYCADKYAHIAGLNPQLVERFERQLLERVDTVVATSLPLVDDLSAHHPNVHYLPHGVDFQRFNDTLSLPARSEADSARPVVGFIGLLGEHIDFELIGASAAALPETEFLFVGPVEQGITLPQADNLTYLGAVPQAELPAQLQRMDVCTLPYAMTQRNHYANPTKVREYLAAGRAVVATKQPGLTDIEGAVSITDTAEDYIAALRQRLTEATALSAAERATYRADIAAPMRDETWQARAAQLRRLLTP